MRNLLVLLVLPLLLSACPRSGSDDDDDAGGSVLDDLDRDGDGLLDPDDLESGEAAAIFDFAFDPAGDDDTAGDAEPEGEEGMTTSTVSLSPSEAAWYLNATFEGTDSSIAVGLRFENAGQGQPALTTGDVTNAWAQPGDGSWYAYASDPGGQVEVVAADATSASGYFLGQTVMEVLGEYEQPTGETVTLSAFAFRDAPIVTPM